MDRASWLQHFHNAPDAVQDFLLSQSATDNERAAQTKLAYDNDAWDRVMDVVWDAVFAQLPKQDFRERLRRLAGDRKPDDVERAALFHVVLPLADLVSWDVEGRLQELGTSMNDLQSVERVSLRPVSYGAAVRRIAAQAKISLLSEEMVRRAREALVSYLKGVRAIEQLKEILQRSQGEGGLGFTPDQSELFVAAMNRFLAVTQVMSEQEYADWLTKFQEESAGDQEPQAPSPKSQPVGDDIELASLASQVPKTPGQFATALDEATEFAVTQIALTTLDDTLQKRLRNIISTRLRDVRNAIQTRAILEREQKVGGLGLAATEADRVASVIEKVYHEQRTRIEEEEKKRIEQTQVAQQGKIEERKKRESEEHAKWFREKVQGTQIEDAAREKIRAAFQAAQASQASPSTATQSAPSVIPTRPSVDSVVPPPVRLVGLAEELGGMTLAAFRRQAKTPDQAAQKIRQKLETLRQESFERWTEGVEAWRRSPLQQQYLKLVAESFAAGKPVAAVVEEKRRTDENIPTPEEIGAIITLNSQIQF